MVTTFTARSSFVRTTGMLCLVGAGIGVLGGLVTAFIPAAVGADRYSYPYTTTGFLVAETTFVVNHLLLLAGLVGLTRSGATGGRPIGRTGAWIAIGAMILLTLCEVASMTLATSAYPTSRTDLLDVGFGVASIGIGLGLVLAGVAVARARAWTGWAGYVVLACGVAVFVVLIPGLMGGFLVARLVITAWMLLWAGIGLALMRNGTDR